MTVIERDRHTTLSIDYHATDLPNYYSNLHLRMYHDGYGQVVSSDPGVDWSRDTYPNSDIQPDQRQQNMFVAEPGLCLSDAHADETVRPC